MDFTGGTAEFGTTVDWYEAQPPGNGAFFQDADGDTLTYSASVQHPALLGVTLTGAAGTAVLTANLLNQGESEVNYTATDPYGGQVTRNATITITANVSREIAENSPAGTEVGDPVTGTPYDNEALSYTLAGSATGKFVIDSATGQISVKEGAALDYEIDDIAIQVETFEDGPAQKFYTGEVRYTVDEISAVINLKIFLTDVDDDPHITLSVSPEYVQEGQAAAQVTLTATRDSTVGDHTVDWSVATDTTQTATDGTDYTNPGRGSCGGSRNNDYYISAHPTDVRIAPGESSASTTVTYNICSDELDDPNETIIWTATASHATFNEAVLTIGDPETITLSVSPDTIAENAGAAEVTVTATMSAARVADTVVNLTLGGTATDTADYTATSLASITIPKGQTSADGTLTITPVDDEVTEGEEAITVSGESGARTVSSAEITITDPVFITLSVNPEYIQEGQTAAKVVLTATRDGTAGDHTIRLSVGGGTATQGADYTIWTLDPGLRIGPGETSASVTLTFTVVADKLEDEGNETVILSGASTAAAVSDAVVTIGQPESIALKVSPDTIAENAGATEVTVTAALSQARATDTVVNLALGGTATDPADYTATSLASITIPKGQTTADGTLTVTPVVDAAVEGDETIIVSGDSGARTVSSADITITDYVAPVISFESAPTSVAEGSDAEYVVKLEGSRTTNVTVRFKTGAAGDLATGGEDYTSVDQTLTFTPTENTKTVTVSTLADTKFEPTEDFTVSLSEAQGGGGTAPVISKGSRTTTIADDFTDDDAYPDSYTLTATPAVVGEGGGAKQITFTATIDDGDKLFATNEVEILVFPNSDRGTRVATEDYTISGHYLRLSIDAGEESASGTLTITPVDDNIVEDDESIVFTSHAGGGMTTSDEPAITLEDNDAATSISLSVSPSVLREGSSDSDSDVTVTATLNGGVTLPGAINVAVSLEDGTAKSDDYSEAELTVTIAAGESSGSGNLTVKVTGDDKAEDDETIKVTGTALPLTVHPAEITILDDDSGRSGIRLTVSPSRVREDAGATVLTVTASLIQEKTFDSNVEISLSLGDGTATQAGGDYSAATGKVTIPKGQQYGTTTLTFTPTSDAVVESDETVRVNGALDGVTVLPATVTIINSSHADLSISGPSAAVAEGTNATFTVTLSAAIAEKLSVAWSAAPNTAVAADYSPASGSVTFPAGSAAGATQTFTVGMTDDALSEVKENFTVELGTVTSSVSAFVAPKSGSFIADAYIAESDPITVSISGPSKVNEGDTTTVYTVSLSPSGVTPTADLTVDYSTSDGTAEAGDDYDGASGTLTFTPTAAGSQTFTVQTTEDTLDESDETFTVSLDDPTGGGGPAPSKHATQHSVTTTITDDDAATGITLSADPDTLEEDQESAETVTVTATLSGGTRTEATVVTIGTLEGTATKDTDYTVTTALASITIPANSTSGTGTITITPIDDKVVEATRPSPYPAPPRFRA